MASVVVSLAALLTWLPLQEPSAEAMVRSFLEETRSGELDAAADRLVGGPSQAFMDSEAVESDWEITEVSQVAYDPGPEGPPEAEVYAEIEAADGTDIGYRYEVVFESGEPRIIGGIFRSAVGYGGTVEVNGVLASGPQITLLPGVYRFYQTPPSTLDIEMPPVLVLGERMVELGGDRTGGKLTDPITRLTAEGENAIDAELRDLVDSCAPAPDESCPFGLAGEYHGLSETEPERPWRVTAYPRATLTGWYAADGMPLHTAEPGAVEFDATITESDGGTVETTVSCPIRLDGLHAIIDYDTGAVEIDDTRGTSPCGRLAESL